MGHEVGIGLTGDIPTQYWNLVQILSLNECDTGSAPAAEDLLESDFGSDPINQDHTIY